MYQQPHDFRLKGVTANTGLPTNCCRFAIVILLSFSANPTPTGFWTALSQHPGFRWSFSFLLPLTLSLSPSLSCSFSRASRFRTPHLRYGCVPPFSRNCKTRLNTLKRCRRNAGPSTRKPYEYGRYSYIHRVIQRVARHCSTAIADLPPPLPPSVARASDFIHPPPSRPRALKAQETTITKEQQK